MESIVTLAEQVLRTSGAPALRISALLQAIPPSASQVRPGLPRFRAMLEARPDLFRVLDPWRGPWRSVRSPSASTGMQEAWVVAVRDDGDGGARENVHRVLRNVHASVRWIGLGLDPSSVRDIVRWNGLILEGMAAQRAFKRAA